MKGDCYIIGRPANIKSDFYYLGDKESHEPKYVPAPEDIRYELDPEFAESQKGEGGTEVGDAMV